MNRSFLLKVLPLFAFIFATSGLVRAEGGKNHSIEDRDGVLTMEEYEVIDLSGATTRGLCPYTCEDRNLAREHCKTWPSAREPEKCYVQDTSKPSGAIDFSGKEKSAK